MRAAAMEALLQRGGLESVGAGGSKATMGVLRAELEQMKQVLAKGQEETKERVLVEVQEMKQEVQETKHELTVLSAVQEETKQQMSAMDGKIDSILALLQTSGRSQ
jgi:anti-sigma factor ChrR (cupin superfamily)